MAYRSDTPVEVEARNNGLRVVVPADNELQIDLDTEEAYQHHLKMLDVLEGRGMVYEYDCQPSKSGLPHRHITIKLVYGPGQDGTLSLPLNPWQRIALQAALGSDPVRELLSCMRVFQGIEPPTAFLELPQEATAPQVTSGVEWDQMMDGQGNWI